MTTTEKNQSKYDFPQFELNPARARFRWVWAGALAWLLLGAVAPVKAADNQGPKTIVPKIANIAGIKVGYSSMAELEGQLGKGKEVTGGHPHGARLWRVKGTSWVIHADAFEYSERGAVVDHFAITVDPKSGEDLPYARLTRNELAWAGGVLLGIDEDNLLKLLKQNSWTPAKLADGWRVDAPGYSPLRSSIYPFKQWEARFTMKGKSLVGIRLEAMEKETKPAR